MDPRPLFGRNALYPDEHVADKLYEAEMVSSREEAKRVVADALKKGELQRGHRNRLTWQSCQRLEDRIRAEAHARSKAAYDKKAAERDAAAARSEAIRERYVQRQLEAAQHAIRRQAALNEFADEKLLANGGKRKG
ncbi:MAG: hypothetical protein WD492_06985 [Alkalispirochaeta sp.]